MSLHPQTLYPVPTETAKVAQAIFPKGNLCLTMAEALHECFSDQDFNPLYPHRGQPATSPLRLALATILQYVEGLTDRQTADAVRSRIAVFSGVRVHDGLITNDKFCWIRQLRLKLSGSESQRLKTAMFSRSTNALEALEGTVPLEVVNEAAVDHQAATPGNRRWTEAMGSSLSTAAACANPAKSGCRRKRVSHSSDPCTPGKDR